MIDFGFDKIALIGAVALIVIGPEKLPRVARTVGHLVGKAQRYVAEVKAEVNRSIELEELQKMKSQFETAARDVETSVRNEVNQASDALSQSWNDAAGSLGSGLAAGATENSTAWTPAPPAYQHPHKNWRLKRAAIPAWYKQREGVRRHVQSGAARVARFRPPGSTGGAK
ncbi:Sec-independent protein translocase protein TatB [Ideonella sp. YS5]|uniref:Sec-independent protein translocase protein TatB n=1 Tax=Ideonella sp. YS5 TaxID=3453714 RepID=UPI003EECB68B